MSTRRDFFAFTAGAVVAKTVLPLVARAETVQHPDAVLIAICAEFDACERQTSIIHGTGPDCVVDDDEANATSAPVFARMRVLLDRMDELRATTPAGIQARAHSLALHGGHGGYSFDCFDSMVGRLLVYLMRDSAALGGSMGAVPVPPSPDAELLRACAAFDQLEAQANATFTGYENDSPEEAAAEAERGRIYDEQDPYVDVICSTVARTKEGMQAKARSLMAWAPDMLRHGGREELLLGSLLNDLLVGRPLA
jgi:hypothetical protein